MNFGFAPETRHQFVCEDSIHPDIVRAQWHSDTTSPFNTRWLCNDCKTRYDAMTEDDVKLYLITRKLESA